MNPKASRAGRVLALTAALLLAQGCATPRPPADAAQGQVQAVSGRLALQVEDNASQSFSASFTLQGTPQAGELELLSPFGATLARLGWGLGGASLTANGQTRQFESLDALAAAATGTPIPIAALFDWLAGTPTPATGWQVDLSQLQQGRLRAQRLQPPPAADLRIALER